MRVILVLVLCAAVCLASQKTYNGYKVYSLQLSNSNDLAALMDLENYAIDFWERPNHNNNPFRVMIPPQMVPQFEVFLRDHGVSYIIVIENVQE